MSISNYRCARSILSGVACVVGLLLVASAQLSAQFTSCASAPAGSQCLPSGDAGIGTTSPAYSLDIGTTSQSFSTPANTVVLGARGSAVFGVGYATTLLDSVGNSGALYINSGNGVPAFSITRSLNISNNDYTIFSMRNLVFAPGSLWNSIFSVGNVGIGSAFSQGIGTSPVPSSSLSVAGGVSVGSYATSTINAGTGNLEVSGRVGVGTQSPGYELDVQGGQINASGGLCINGSCQTSWPVSYSGGDVGVGTTTPQAKLDVEGGSVRINNTASGETYPLVIQDLMKKADTTGTYAGLLLQSADTSNPLQASLVLFSNSIVSSRYLRIGAYDTDNSSAWDNVILQGNVGIGTTSPVHPLQVAGTIGAEEVVVSSTGADYVFDPGYRLAPLSEVASYVEANHHLPGIPSAAEVQEKGVSLGDMQTKLLAKVEELTLHMIAAEKENERLEKQNQELSREIREIREDLTQ